MHDLLAVLTLLSSSFVAPNGWEILHFKAEARVDIGEFMKTLSGCMLMVWQIYDEFSPLHLKQFDDRTVMKMETYDAALDEFFSKIEGQRADQQRKAQEDSAFSKLDKIRADQVIL